MRVLIADKFETVGVNGLRALGCDVVSEPGKKGAELVASVRAANPSVLVVRSTKVSGEMMDAAAQLALIVRAGAGVDNIDVGAASQRGVLVANCPGMNAIAVAELALALILSLDRRVPDCVAELRTGKWNKAEYSKARGLKGMTLGLVGLGPIGRAVAHRANAFELNVRGWSRSMSREGAVLVGVQLCRTWREVVEQSDIVSMHIAATPETRDFCNRAFFEAMKPGSYFINTSRGDVVDFDALTWAVKEKGIRAGLDVYANEPAAATAEFKEPLFASGGVVYGTPHIAASTDQAQLAIAAETVRIVRVFRETGAVENCVNLLPQSSGRRMLVVRHFNKPGVLAHVLSHISNAKINVEDMENVMLREEKTAIARIRLASTPNDGVLNAIRAGNSDIIALSLMEMPG